jgi:[CysO sulfur-carrier protein]-S-L-cysteine hydrolase
MIKMNNHLYNQLIEYCRHQLPLEACGALFGNQEQDLIAIQSIRPITNIASSSNNQIEFDHNQLLKLLYSPQKVPWIGIFHSHPLSAAYPSTQDLQNPWHLPVYAILSFAHSNQPIMKSFEIMPNQKKMIYSFKEQTIEIIADSF